METSTNNWLKLFILIILFSFLLVRSVNWEMNHHIPNSMVILIDCVLGLLTGKFLSLASPSKYLEKFKDSFLGILVGWGVLWVVWYLPVWFPFLKSNEYGFTINLRESSVVLWMAAAFLFGYYHRLTLFFVYIIPAALWNRLKMGEINKSILSFWNGLKSIIGST